MAAEDVLTFADTSFQQEVLESKEPVLVDFWATWCAPCRAMTPVVDALAKDFKGRVKIGKMNVDEHQGVPQKYGIRSIPTMLLFKGGRVVDQIVGAVPRARIEDALKKAL